MKKKIIFASILFVLITVSSQFIFHMDIKRQSYDSKIIAISGKQRVYSQQITKIALYANEVKDLYRYYIDLDSLSTIVDDFKQDNFYLKNITSKNYKNDKTDALFKENQIYFRRMVEASNKTIDYPNDQEMFEEFVKGVKNNEAKFSSTMDELVNEYQAISEQKLRGFEKILTLYSIVILIFLILLLWFIIIPLYKKTKFIDSE
ncbi:MAG: hypothetical protein AB8B78_03430 [Polaribacter sp.]